MLKLYDLKLKLHILRLKMKIYTVNVCSVIIIVIEFLNTNSSQNDSILMQYFQ